MIQIIFNGVPFNLPENTTLADFLHEKLPDGKFAIEVDLEVVPRPTYANFILKNGMKIEAITFVGGG
jgi:thiamine biosynthesis protein ThiS